MVSCASIVMSTAFRAPIVLSGVQSTADAFAKIVGLQLEKIRLGMSCPPLPHGPDARVIKYIIVARGKAGTRLVGVRVRDNILALTAGPGSCMTMGPTSRGIAGRVVDDGTARACHATDRTPVVGGASGCLTVPAK